MFEWKCVCVCVSPESEIMGSSFLSTHVSFSGRLSRSLSCMDSSAIMSSSFLHSCCLQGAPHTTITHFIAVSVQLCVGVLQSKMLWFTYVTHVFMPYPIAAAVRWWCWGKGSESFRSRPLNWIRPFSLVRPSWSDACSGRDSTTLSRATGEWTMKLLQMALLHFCYISIIWHFTEQCTVHSAVQKGHWNHYLE